MITVAGRARDDVTAELHAALLGRTTQLRAVERPLVGLGIAEPVLGPEHGAAAHAAELQPVVPAHRRIGVGLRRVVGHGAGNVEPAGEEIPVRQDRQARVKLFLQRPGAVREVTRGVPGIEAHRPVEQTPRRQRDRLAAPQRSNVGPFFRANIGGLQSLLLQIGVKASQSGRVGLQGFECLRIIPPWFIRHGEQGHVLRRVASIAIRCRLLLRPVGDGLGSDPGIVVEGVSRRTVDGPGCAPMPGFQQDVADRFGRRQHDGAETRAGELLDPFAPFRPVIVAADEAIDDRELFRPLCRRHLDSLQRLPVTPIVDRHRRRLRSFLVVAPE